jgi:hypothetical protein
MNMAKEAQAWEATGAAPPVVYTWVWPMAIGGAVAVLIGAVTGLIVDFNHLAKNDKGEMVVTLAALRLIPTVIGMLAVGLAVSLRPKLVPLLALASVTSLVARAGFHPDWDSGRMLCVFGAIVAGVAAILMALPVNYRRVAVSVLVLLHFGAILGQVTAPGAQPWIGNQIASCVTRPYVQFVYLTNAYHFYSPEPGPAHILWFCINYDTPLEEEGEKDVDGKPKIEKTKIEQGSWFTLPRRPEDMKDPLSLSYYRRLSITETAYAPAEMGEPTGEQMRARISRASGKDGIRFHPEFRPETRQFLPPNQEVRDHILPEYVKHVARDPEAQHTNPHIKIKSIKVYMVTHRLLTPAQLAEYNIGFYDPPTYLPYFMGEYDVDGNILRRDDPMLYWLVPIIYEPKNMSVPVDHTYKTHPNEFNLIDGVERHCGFPAPIVKKDATKKEAK